MKNNKIVLDTNCLISSLSRKSPTYNVWKGLLRGDYVLCVSIEIIKEYEEIIALKTNNDVARNVIETLINCRFVEVHEPYYRFNLIESDRDDNKFVDCAIASNACFIVSEDSHFKILSSIPFPHIEVIDLLSFSSYLYSMSNGK